MIESVGAIVYHAEERAKALLKMAAQFVRPKINKINIFRFEVEPLDEEEEG